MEKKTTRAKTDGKVGGDLQPRKRPMQKRSRESAERILAAARKLLREHGVQAISTNAISAESDVAIGSIYQYFPNKEAIILAVLDRMMAGLKARLAETVEAMDGSRDWRALTRDLLAANEAAEREVGWDARFSDALYYLPELHEAARSHSLAVARTLARFLRRIGSLWPDSALEDLGAYLYTLGSARWTYMRLVGPREETQFREWQMHAMLAVIGSALTEEPAGAAA